MNYFHLDASAWVKRYIMEQGTDWISQFWLQSRPTACSTLGLIEVMSTVARRHAHEDVDLGVTCRSLQGVRRDFDGFHRVALSRAVLSIAETLPEKHRLRGADCVHLASAMSFQEVMGQPVTIIACDLELLQAARSVGFAVLDPRASPPISAPAVSPPT